MPAFVFPAPYVAAAAASPASYVFNGSDEHMEQQTFSFSSPVLTSFTLSFWRKITAYTAGKGGNSSDLFAVTTAGFDETFFEGEDYYGVSDEILNYFKLDNSFNLEFDEVVNIGEQPTPGNWGHVVVRYDSTQGTAANRLRIYLNGNLQSVDSAVNPSSNEQSIMFSASLLYRRYGNSNFNQRLNGKMAFIDVINASAAPSAFGFDDGGTWTRRPYTGSFGVNDSSFDGTDGFNDVSGNGIHIDALTNMDETNLDTADLPPYTL